jgi:hypothetical protein
MICDYSHTVTQYAGYKVVSWSSSECCRFLLHNRGIRFMLRKIHHTRSARRLTTNYINMIRLKTFSSPWRFTQLDQWNAQLLGCRLGNNVSLVSTLHRRMHCRDPVLRNRSVFSESCALIGSEVQLEKNQQIQFLAASTCSCVSFIPGYGSKPMESSSVHTIASQYRKS